MRLAIPKDVFNNPTQPQIFLCNTDKSIIGELDAYDVQLDANWNQYSELTFSINRRYTDLIAGEVKLHPLFDKAEGLRKVYVKGIGYFIIQDPDSLYSDQESKTLKCFSSEYETGQRYLESFHINTGETTSAEVIYQEEKYGVGYSIDELYEKVTNYATSNYDAYQKYYKKEFASDAQTFTYELVQIVDENEFATYDGFTENATLYIKKYDNVRFYWNTPGHEGLSLLHLVFKKIPNWSIGHVDASLCKQERRFEEERIAVYDFLMNEMSEAFDCIVEWDTLKNEVNFYAATEDGLTTENSVDTQFDTDIYISRENLASEINVSYSTDDIKTKLRVNGGSEDIDIRDVNLGQNYIMNLEYYNTIDWLGEDLYNAWNNYTQLIDEKTSEYQVVLDRLTSAYTTWNDLMNAVPSDFDVLLVGDVFTKLYCTYTTVESLTNKLNLYYTKENYNIEDNDNVLFTLRDTDQNSAVIRVSYTNDAYEVKVTKRQASIGYDEEPQLFSLSEWIEGKLTDAKFDVKGYKITSIGTLGAYLCLAKDESDPVNLEEYGIKLLQEKKDVYMQIFNVQTEGLFSSEDYQCVASEEKPSGSISTGDFWLETDTAPLVLWQYDGNKWVKVNVEDDLQRCKDYARFIDNYNKLQAVQQVLTEKEKLATYLLNGVKLNEWYFTPDTTSQAKLRNVAKQYFNTSTPISFTLKTPTQKPNYTEDVNVLRSGQESIAFYGTSGDSFLSPVLIVMMGDTTFVYAYEETTDWFGVTVPQGWSKDEKDAYIPYDMDANPITIPYEDGMIWDDMITVFFDINTIADIHYDENIPLYVFMTSYDNQNQYAIYLQSGVPCVAYYNSVGASQAQMNYIKSITDMDTYFTETQWERLAPFIREDEYSNDNIAFVGYESDVEKLDLRKTLLEEAQKELQKICQPRLTFSMDMANILALQEFQPLLSRFQLGNFVRVELRPGYVQRARLLGVSFSLSDFSDFSAEFGNLITTKSEIDKHAELLKQAVQAGKTVASNANNWQKAVDKSTALDQAINDGLKDAALSVGSANNQSIVWDQYGIWGRKLVDGTIDQYDPEQFRMINNKLVFSADGFKTSKSVFGKFRIKDKDEWGVLADAVVAGYIEGSEIYGGTLDIGGPKGHFRVAEDGSVTITAGTDGTADITISKYDDAIDLLESTRQFHIELSYSGTTIFTQKNMTTRLICRIYEWDDDITDRLPVGTTFKWKRSSNDINKDMEWNNDPLHTITISENHTDNYFNILDIGNDDVVDNAQFSCEVKFDETQILPKGDDTNG